MKLLTFKTEINDNVGVVLTPAQILSGLIVRKSTNIVNDQLPSAQAVFNAVPGILARQAVYNRLVQEYAAQKKNVPANIWSVVEQYQQEIASFISTFMLVVGDSFTLNYAVREGFATNVNLMGSTGISFDESSSIEVRAGCSVTILFQFTDVITPTIIAQIITYTGIRGADQSLSKRYTTRDVNAISVPGPYTYSVSEFLGGIILRNPAGASRVDVTPSAVEIINSTALDKMVGSYAEITLHNVSSADKTVSLSPGAGVSFYNGNPVFQPGEIYSMVAIVTNKNPGTEAITIYNMGAATPETMGHNLPSNMLHGRYNFRGMWFHIGNGLTISPPSADKYPTLSVTSTGGTTFPGGTDTQVQFNDNGAFGGALNFVWDKVNLRVGIGTTTPDTALHVVGSPKFVDGNQAAGRVWTSDATGVGSWVAPATTTPGGANTHIQFNNGGAFGGDSTFTWDNVAKTLRVNGPDPAFSPAHHIIGRFAAGFPFPSYALQNIGFYLQNSTVTGTVGNADFTLYMTPPGPAAAGIALNAIVRDATTVSTNISQLFGAAITAAHYGTGTITANLNALTVLARNESSAGPVANLHGIFLTAANNSTAGAVTNMYGIRITSSKVSGATVTNAYGLFISDTSTIGTNHWNISSLGINSRNYFQGRVGIGTATPDTILHVVGSPKFVDGNQAAGRVWTSDTDGVGSWQDASGGAPGGSDTQVQFNDGGVFGGANDFVWDKTNSIATLGTNTWWAPYLDNPGGKLHVEKLDVVDGVGAPAGFFGIHSSGTTGADSLVVAHRSFCEGGSSRALKIFAEHDGADTDSGELVGMWSYVVSPSRIPYIIGTSTTVDIRYAGTGVWSIGHYAAMSISSDCTIQELMGYMVQLYHGFSGSTVNNMYGMRITSPYGTDGTVDNLYGLWIDSMHDATNGWNIYSKGEASRNFFEGRVGIGVLDPAKKLEVRDTTGAQLRLSYDASNYADFEVDSGGSLTITPTNPSSVTVVGRLNIRDNTGYISLRPVDGYGLVLEQQGSGGPYPRLEIFNLAINVPVMPLEGDPNIIGGDLYVDNNGFVKYIGPTIPE